jgi:two-component system sensor histidine kinase AgrC
VSPGLSSPAYAMEFTDLIRILGILLDNAIEECVELEHGSITIKISQNDDLISYAIKNTLRPENNDKTIKTGASEKGAGRGRGLLIVREILNKYDFVVLNTYYQDDGVVQNLAIYQNP